MHKQLVHISIVALLVTAFLGWEILITHAQSAKEIERQIRERNERIERLEREIQQHEKDLQVVGQEKQTLKGAIQTLDISRQKIATDITLTQNKIGATDLEINEIEAEVAEKETRVEVNRKAIAEALRTINEVESASLIETMLVHENISEVWDQVETLQRFQIVMQDDVHELNELKRQLEESKAASERKRDQLSEFNRELAGQKTVLDENRKDKNQLLSVTENKEANYQRLLAEKRAARERFEQELQDLEAQLKFTLDPDTIPAVGQGILGWPLDNLRVTQYFGNTPFAKSGGYGGSGHNGIDFAASQGSSVNASLGGTVMGTGNTDLVPGCFSYGKWVLLRHNNGLATLYAHLSAITVNQGQSVGTGESIGFSGNTGYSTGPHLHYSVYLADAVQIVRLGDVRKITNCGPARIPIAPLEAYLNPLDYLRGADLLR